ncbi:MAG: hypothetical protein ACXVW6_11710 [Nocardioidaceae bacterium]
MTTMDGPGHLRVLLDEVHRARAIHAEQRHRGVPWPQELESRRETLIALENYVAALERNAWPVPREIRDELRLCRTLCRPGT